MDSNTVEPSKPAENASVEAEKNACVEAAGDNKAIAVPTEELQSRRYRLPKRADILNIKTASRKKGPISKSVIRAQAAIMLKTGDPPAMTKVANVVEADSSTPAAEAEGDKVTESG